MYLYLCASILHCLCVCVCIFVCVCRLFLLPFPPLLLPVLCLAEFYYCRDGKFKLEFTNDTEKANETL